MLNHTTPQEDRIIESAEGYAEATSPEHILPLIEIIERLDGLITKNGNDSNTVEEEMRSAARESRSRILDLEADVRRLEEENSVLRADPTDFHGAAPRKDAATPVFEREYLGLPPHAQQAATAEHLVRADIGAVTQGPWAGDGYRLLRKGEVTAIGDQCYVNDGGEGWADVYGLAGHVIGDPLTAGYRFRRKIDIDPKPDPG